MLRPNASKVNVYVKDGLLEMENIAEVSLIFTILNTLTPNSFWLSTSESEVLPEFIEADPELFECYYERCQNGYE